MEMELKNIIEKIKEEGVSAAEKEAADIVGQAEEKAAGIIKAAEDEKEEIIKRAEKAAVRLQKNAEEAMKQASRDVLLGLREKIVAVFDSVVKHEVAEQLSPEVLKNMIVSLVEKFREEGEAAIEVLLSEKDKAELERLLFGKFREKVAEGVVLKVSPHVEKGFRIGGKGRESYYDFTDEAITEAFKTFLNPKIVRMLNAGG